MTHFGVLWAVMAAAVAVTARRHFQRMAPSHEALFQLKELR